ncbi:MAG: winged helix-turn-helix transcriptional regulator [Phycisphaeraceae bacterium]|nr:winged helix-turn-helix transcriptional regulator [Phycisphaeraceae bacterium]
MNLPSSPRQAAALLRAMGHPQRLRLLASLERHPLTVSDLADRLRARLPVVSHHLAILRHARLVSAHRRGRQVFYRLTNPQVAPILRTLRRDEAFADSFQDGAAI